MKALLFLWLACLLTIAPGARAEVQRFAVLAGNNEGHAGDVTLRYAASDAAKTYGVLRELGGFEPANMVLLQNEDATVFRRTLINVNDRIRAAQLMPNTETLLFVYYSGHADGSALRMGKSRFDVAELGQLVRGSAATIRVLVVDACRSGTLTRSKGGRIVSAFPIAFSPELGGEGFAFLTATSANEDAQESDEIKGSFFTHALVSGLLGAADYDGDRAVVLEEAYRHAYDATLRATSRTVAGVQHPSFRYDLRGQNRVVLTRVAAGASAQRGGLLLPPRIGVLILRDRADGPVVAELTASDPARFLSLSTGRYFVRARGEDVLYEGTIDVPAGKQTGVALTTLKRVEYARLVRKGAPERRSAHGPQLGVSVRGRLPGTERACVGGALGYRADFEQLGVLLRASACTGGFDNDVLRATTNEYDLSGAALHTWDAPWLSFDLGLGVGAALFTQRFDSAGNAPSRDSVSPFVFVTAGMAHDFSGGFFTGLDGRAETHFLKVQERSAEPADLTVAFALRATLLFGRNF